MTEQFANLAASTLAADITSGAAALGVHAGEGSRFPSTGTFRIRVDDEIMIVGARSGDSLTSITRHAEGTAAAAHLAGATVRHVLTAASIGLIPAYAAAAHVSQRGIHHAASPARTSTLWGDAAAADDHGDGSEVDPAQQLRTLYGLIPVPSGRMQGATLRLKGVGASATPTASYDVNGDTMTVGTFVTIEGDGGKASSGVASTLVQDSIGVVTTLAGGGIGPTDMALTVQAGAGAGMSNTGELHIDRETILYSSKSGDVLTLSVRGASGTFPTSHSAGATVTLAKPIFDLSGYSALRKFLTTNLGPFGIGARLGFLGPGSQKPLLDNVEFTGGAGDGIQVTGSNCDLWRIRDVWVEGYQGWQLKLGERSSGSGAPAGSVRDSAFRTHNNNGEVPALGRILMQGGEGAGGSNWGMDTLDVFHGEQMSSPGVMMLGPSGVPWRNIYGETSVYPRHTWWRILDGDGDGTGRSAKNIIVEPSVRFHGTKNQMARGWIALSSFVPYDDDEGLGTSWICDPTYPSNPNFYQLTTLGGQTLYTVWSKAQVVVLNTVLEDPNGHLQKLTTAGTTGSSQPTWNMVGGTTADGTAVWTDQGLNQTAASNPFAAGDAVGATITDGKFVWTCRGFPVDAQPIHIVSAAGVLIPDPPGSPIWLDADFVDDLLIQRPFGSGFAGTVTLEHPLFRIGANVRDADIELGVGTTSGFADDFDAAGGDYRVFVNGPGLGINGNEVRIANPHNGAWNTIGAGGAVLPIVAAPGFGVFASRPAPGNLGAEYLASDLGAARFYDDGTEWLLPSPTAVSIIHGNPGDVAAASGDVLVATLWTAPANLFAAGRTGAIRCRLSGSVDAANSATARSFVGKAKVGTTTVGATSAMVIPTSAAQTDKAWSADLLLTIDGGASGHVIGDFRFADAFGNGAADKNPVPGDSGPNPNPIDWTTPIAVALYLNFGTVVSGDKIRLKHAVLELVAV